VLYNFITYLIYYGIIVIIVVSITKVLILGIGDWGLGIAIPNPQSPIPNKLLCEYIVKNLIPTN